MNKRKIDLQPSKVASLCDGAVYYGELTHQRLLGEQPGDQPVGQPGDQPDGQPEEDFHQVGGTLVVQLCTEEVLIQI